MNATAYTPEEMNWADYVDALKAQAFEARFKHHALPFGSAPRRPHKPSTEVAVRRTSQVQPDTEDTPKS